MALMMLVFWGLLAALVVWIVRRSTGGQRASGGCDRTLPSPDGVLADRFARGEIDEAEFVSRRAALHGAGARLQRDQ
jgi:putative membrane protein